MCPNASKVGDYSRAAYYRWTLNVELRYHLK